MADHTLSDFAVCPYCGGSTPVTFVAGTDCGAADRQEQACCICRRRFQLTAHIYVDTFRMQDDLPTVREMEGILRETAP